MSTVSSPADVASVSPGRRDWPRIVQSVLLLSGILSSLVYIAANVVAAVRFEGYSAASQTISELSAIGAPSRSVWIALMIPYGVFLLAFGIGVWRSAGRRRGLRVAAGMLITIAALGPFWPPMHLRGTVTSLTDTMHVVFASVVSLLILLAVGFGATAFGKRFCLYSIATLVALVGFGTLTFLDAPQVAANLPTPWIGVWERINLSGYLLWVAVLAIALLRANPAQRAWQTSQHDQCR